MASTDMSVRRLSYRWSPRAVAAIGLSARSSCQLVSNSFSRGAFAAFLAANAASTESNPTRGTRRAAIFRRMAPIFSYRGAERQVARCEHVPLLGEIAVIARDRRGYRRKSASRWRRRGTPRENSGYRRIARALRGGPEPGLRLSP